MDGIHIHCHIYCLACIYLGRIFYYTCIRSNTEIKIFHYTRTTFPDYYRVAGAVSISQTLGTLLVGAASLLASEQI